MKRETSVILWMVIEGMFIAGAAFSQDLGQLKGQYARGITVEGSPRQQGAPQPAANGQLGVQYAILTEDQRPVSSAHHFKSGERFSMRLRVNQDGYVYILNRTVLGSSLSRGIDVVPTSKATSYQLLFPRGQSVSNHVNANEAVLLPQSGLFRMDETPGEEKILIVVSRTRIDIAKYYDIATGEPAAPQSESGGSPTARSNLDLQQCEFSAKVREWNENAEFAEAPDSSNTRGIAIDRVESVGVARDSQKPMALVLDLLHLPE